MREPRDPSFEKPQNLEQAFRELRQICRAESYILEAGRRTDRKTSLSWAI